MTICEQINQLIRNQSAEEPISEIHITKEDYKRLQEECLLHTNEREFLFAIDNTLDNPMGYSIRYQGIPVYIDEFETELSHDSTVLPYEMINIPYYDIPPGVYMQPGDYERSNYYDFKRRSYQWTIDNPYVEIEVDEININENELDSILNI